MKYLWMLLFSMGAICAEETDQFAIKVSESEGKAIHEIVTTLGTHSLISLGFKKGHLKELGHGLKGLGCLNFLGYIFLNQELKSHMKTIRKSSFKWNGFMDSLKPSFERAYKSNQLFIDLPGFAAITKADHKKLLLKAEQHDWDEFVGILVETANTK